MVCYVFSPYNTKFAKDTYIQKFTPVALTGSSIHSGHSDFYQNTYMELSYW